MRCRSLCAALALAVLLSIVAPALAPRPARSGALLTVGAFLVTAKITQNLVGEIIKDAEQSVKSILQEFHAQVGSLIAQVEATYGSALDTTLDSLDQFTATQFSRLGVFLDDLNQKLLAGISAVETAVINIIKEANQTIAQALAQMEDLVIVGVRGATYVLDKTTYNVLFFVAVVCLGVGLLFFIARLWKGLLQGALPRTIALLFMALYLGLFGALLLPTVRAYAITMVGQAEQLEQIGSGPRIFNVTPSKVGIGATMEMTLAGANFDSGGAPTVTVAGQIVTPAAWGDSFVALKLTGGIFASLKGNQPVNLTTADGKTASTMVEFVQPPPPPQVTAFRIVPTGKAEEFRRFGPVYVECTKDKGSVDVTVLVGEGYTLAMDEAHVGRVVPASEFRGSYPNPARGYDEAKVSFHNAGKKDEAWRDITYFPEASQRKTGIRIKGECHNGTNFPDFWNGWETWFKAHYSVWGRREVTKDGIGHQGGPCTINGVSKCTTYPAGNLSEFTGRRPEAYKVWVTVRTPGGKLEDLFKVLRPGIPEDRLMVENVSLWMENDALMVRGPVIPKFPIFKDLVPIIRDPKKLPILFGGN